MVEFDDLIGSMSAAVEAELLEVRQARAGRRIALRAGSFVSKSDEDWLYRFGLDQAADIPEDVPAELELPDGSIYGVQTVSSAGFDLTVAAAAEIKGALSAAHLVLDPAFLLEKLLERLQTLEEERCALALALFGARQPYGLPVAPFECDDANMYQRAAVQAVLERDVAYIWGPPGTGKTTTLALIGQALAERGLRVLMVASTNIAIDNAVVRLAERLSAETVVRFGVPQLPELRASQTRGLFDEPSAVVVVPSKRQKAADEEQARLRALRQARVLGTTIARAYLSPEMGTFDAVLVDEASAAPLPALFCAASLASDKVAVLGDPKQLPPVARANQPIVAEWLKRDVFHQAGLSDDDERSVLLREQYRMHPDISRLANQLVYGGRLVDAGVPRRGACAVRLEDTTPLEGSVERVDGSRRNEVSARRAMEILTDLPRLEREAVLPEDEGPSRAARVLADELRRRLGLPPAASQAESAADGLRERYDVLAVVQELADGIELSSALTALDELAGRLQQAGVDGAHWVLNLRARALRLHEASSEVAKALLQVPLRRNEPPLPRSARG
ncbi:MAG: AAA family ATPase, partial [Chloroflexi bacterium]|nr:AAA family ATPase [Chloroflexota bacterium]